MIWINEQSFLNMLFSRLIQMYQTCGPSVNSVFPLESAGAAFPFCNQADLFQSFGSGAMEDQCSLSLLDTALPHTTNPQFAFQKQVIVARGTSNLYDQWQLM